MAFDAKADLTGKLADASVAFIGELLATEVRENEKHRDYITDRMLRRAQKRVSKILYALPATVMPKKGESGQDYIQRLYAVALREACQ